MQCGARNEAKKFLLSKIIAVEFFTPRKLPAITVFVFRTDQLIGSLVVGSILFWQILQQLWCLISNVHCCLYILIYFP